MLCLSQEPSRRCSQCNASLWRVEYLCHRTRRTAELGASSQGAPARLHGVHDLVQACLVHDVTVPVAEKFGEIRADLLDRGLPVGELDLLHASTALIHNLTLATHNVLDYANVPGLTVVDWQVP